MKPAIAPLKRTTRDHEMHPETKRTRYHHSTEAKFIFAALFLKAEARGVSQKEFLSDMKVTDYSMTNQPFSDRVRDMKSHGRVGVVNRKSPSLRLFLTSTVELQSGGFIRQSETPNCSPSRRGSRGQRAIRDLHYNGYRQQLSGRRWLHSAADAERKTGFSV